MNKKLLTPLVAVFAIALVVAGVGYYAITSYVISINQPIGVTGPTSFDIDCDAGDTCRGAGITITNDGDSERTIDVSDNAGDYPNAIDDIRYVSELTLAQKVVNFDLDVWELLGGGNTAVVKYTIVGDEFSAEIIEGKKTGYVLVYYKDNSDRFNSPATAIGVDSVSGNLPYEDDANADEYDYCLTGEYDTCHGAKLWYVPSTAISEGGNVVWSQASNFLFETKLIQFNSNGEIVIFPGAELTIYPEVDINKYATEGDRTLDVTIA